MATLVTAPERSVDQRMEALLRANDVRSQRALVKRDLKAGRVSIRDLIADPPPVLANAKVVDFLIAVPKRGRVKVAKTLKTCRVSPSKTFGGLSDRQRRALAAAIGDPDRAPYTARPPQAQRSRALQLANTIRLARSEVHRRVLYGELSVRDVLNDPPDCVVSLEIGELLRWEARWGDYRVTRLLSALWIGELRPVGALTERQCLVIAQRMERDS